MFGLTHTKQRHPEIVVSARLVCRFPEGFERIGIPLTLGVDMPRLFRSFGEVDPARTASSYVRIAASWSPVSA